MSPIVSRGGLSGLYPGMLQGLVWSRVKDSKMARGSSRILADDDNDTSKPLIDHVANADSRDPTREAPRYVAGLTPEDREKAEKALVRKIDWRLLPIVIVMYILNYLDRNNIASARLAGLEEDLDLVRNQYQTCVSILFVGYLLMQSMSMHAPSTGNRANGTQSPPTCCSTNAPNRPSTWLCP